MANLFAFENEGICVLAFSNQSGIAAILPLVFRRGRRYLIVRRWTEFAGLPHADHGGSLVLAGHELAVAESFMEFLEMNLGPSDGLCLDRLSADDEFARALISVARKQGWHVVAQPSDTIRQLSREDYGRTEEQEISSASLEKARRKLAANGELQFEVYDRPEQIEDQLEIFARLHIERFSRQGIESPWASPVHRRFYEQMLRECAISGYVWFSRLTCGGVPAAMRISLLWNGVLHLYSTCFDQKFARFSPSILQLQMLMEYAFHHGVTAVDFGIGESPHKQQVGATEHSRLMRVELYRNRLPFFEKRSYDMVDRVGARWPLFRRAGRKLRRLLPYGM